jgi:MarR family transcriptional regulator, transcriptional regulator for hemolysin
MVATVADRSVQNYSLRAYCKKVDLSFLLNQASYAFAARLADALAEVELSVREYCVLWKAAEQPRTQAEIATLAGLDKTTMVVTLDRLTDRGLAQRTPSPTDRRARLVEVTDAGAGAYERGRVIVERVTEEVLGALAPADRAAFTRGLEALVRGTLAEPSHVRPERRKEVRASR